MDASIADAGAIAPATATGATTEATSTGPRRNPTSFADAAERRLKEQQQNAAEQAESYSAFDQNHEKRQEFRRLIDPGILRHNPKHIAMESLRVHTLSRDSFDWGMTDYISLPRSW